MRKEREESLATIEYGVTVVSSRVILSRNGRYYR